MQGCNLRLFEQPDIGGAGADPALRRVCGRQQYLLEWRGSNDVLVATERHRQARRATLWRQSQSLS